MDRPQPIRLTRQQLGTFLKTPELVRAFEAYIKALAELTPDELVRLDLRIDDAETSAVSAQMMVAVAMDIAGRAADQAQQVESLTSAVASVRAQLHALTDRVNSLESEPIK